MCEEFVFCLDSANTVRSFVPSNPTNDVVIEVDPQPSVTFRSFELATLELPATQRLIEPGWGRVRVYSAPRVLEEPFEVESGVVPRTLNPVVSVVSDVVTLAHEHHISSKLPKGWSVHGLPVQPLALEGYIEVLSPTSFRLPSGATLPSVGPPLYLRAPTLETHDDLAEALGLKYDPLTGQFKGVSAEEQRALRDFGAGCITVAAGNYTTAEQLGQELARQSERFVVPVGGEVLVTSLGTVVLAEGVYDGPAGLAAEIAGSGLGFDVYFTEQKFHFTAATVFTLDLEASSHLLAWRLGFPPIKLSGQTEYASMNPLVECSLGILLNWALSENGKLQVTTSAPPRVDVAPGWVPGSSTVPTVQAHGLRKGELVRLFPGEEEVLVLSAPGAALLELSLGVGALTALERSTPTAPVSLMLAKQEGQEHDPMPEILGFPAMDTLPSPLTAPFPPNLIGSSFVMMQLLSPEGGSASIQQLSRKGESITQAWAKVLVNNTTVRALDRPYPMHMQFFSGARVSTMHIRFLNPDHTLYELHGKRWSATMIARS